MVSRLASRGINGIDRGIIATILGEMARLAASEAKVICAATFAFLGR